MSVHPSSLQPIVDRVCGEYLEMPGLRLTLRQAQRLWGLDEPTCRLILNELLQAGFLRQTYDGRFARLLDEPVSSRPLKMGPPGVRRRAS